MLFKKVESAPDGDEELLCVCEGGYYLFLLGNQIKTHNINCYDGRYQVVGWYLLPKVAEFEKDLKEVV